MPKYKKGHYKKENYTKAYFITVYFTHELCGQVGRYQVDFNVSETHFGKLYKNKEQVGTKQNSIEQHNILQIFKVNLMPINGRMHYRLEKNNKLKDRKEHNKIFYL